MALVVVWRGGGEGEITGQENCRGGGGGGGKSVVTDNSNDRRPGTDSATRHGHHVTSVVTTHS